MLSLVGGLLLCGACAYAGIKAALGLKKRAALLAELVSMLELMSAEIRFRLTPLPELMDVLAQSFPALKNHFTACVMELRHGKNASQAWREAWQTANLQKHERKTLEEVGAVLGRYDAQTQAEALAYARGRMERLQKSAELAYASQGKLYGTLGIAGGVIMTVLFL